MDRAERLGKERILPLLLRFSIPAIVGMLVQALYNVVDRIFVGNGVGALGLAGLSIVFPVMLVQMAFVMLVGLGATALISIRLGEGRREEAEKIMANALGLLVLIAVIGTTAGILFLDPVLRLLGASDAVLPYAHDYLSIILYGAIFQAVGFGLNHMIRAQGSPAVAMATMLIGAISNAILDPVFIFVFGLGVKGAAFATILAQALSAAWVLSYFLRGKSQLRLNWRAVPRLELHVVKQIATIGFAPFSIQMASSVQNLILNQILIRHGGDLAISAMSIVFSLNTLILMPIFGVNQGAQPILGFNYGAKQYDRVRQTFRYAAGGATIIVCLGFLATRLFPRQLVSLFGRQDADLIALGVQAVRTATLGLPVVGLQIVGSNFFQALGKPTKASLLSLSRQVLPLIPLVLILPRFLGLAGVFASYPLSDVGAAAVTAILVLREFAHLSRAERQEAPAALVSEVNP